ESQAARPPGRGAWTPGSQVQSGWTGRNGHLPRPVFVLWSVQTVQTRNCKQETVQTAAPCMAVFSPLFFGWLLCFFTASLLLLLYLGLALDHTPRRTRSRGAFFSCFRLHTGVEERLSGKPLAEQGFLVG